MCFLFSGFKGLEFSYFLLFPSLISQHLVDLLMSACCHYPQSPWNKPILTWKSQSECQVLLADKNSHWLSLITFRRKFKRKISLIKKKMHFLYMSLSIHLIFIEYLLSSRPWGRKIKSKIWDSLYLEFRIELWKSHFKKPGNKCKTTTIRTDMKK